MQPTTRFARRHCSIAIPLYGLNHRSWRCLLQHAVIVEVDNSREDPEQGRRELRGELAPAMEQMPGFVNGTFMTDYEQGRGLAVMVFESRDVASQIAGGLVVGNELRNGVIITRVEVMEVPAIA